MLKELKRQRAALIASMKAITTKEGELGDGAALDQGDLDQFAQLEIQIAGLDGRISRLETLAAAEADGAEPADPADPEPMDPTNGGKGAVPTHGQPREPARPGVPAKAALKIEKGIVLAGMTKMLVLGGGSLRSARDEAKDVYGESHPVTKALQVSQGSSGGFVVPPDYVAELIELLRANTVVRGSGPRVLPMPRGTMTMPRQSQAATAGYGAEISAIPTSQQAADQVVATYKKLTALVPVSNDLLRYSDPSFDAVIRDDLVEVFARREDLAFIRGDGTQDSPRGFLSFALPGQMITSTAAFTYATAAQELGGALNKVESANVPWRNPVWLMAPRVKNYLLNVQNTIGAYIYKDEMEKGTLLGVPFKITTQIPTNLVVGGNTDCSEIYLVEMSQAMIFDSMSLELAISREATYIDNNGTAVNTFQVDQTLVRAIAEHDFQMRHPEAIAMVTGVRYAPAIA